MTHPDPMSLNSLDRRDLDTWTAAGFDEDLPPDVCVHDVHQLSDNELKRYQESIARSKTMTNNNNTSPTWNLVRRADSTQNADGEYVLGEVTHVLNLTIVEAADDPTENYIKLLWKGQIDSPAKLLLVSRHSFSRDDAQALVNRMRENGCVPIAEFNRVRVGAAPFSCIDPLSSPVTREFELNPRNHMG